VQLWRRLTQYNNFFNFVDMCKILLHMAYYANGKSDSAGANMNVIGYIWTLYDILEHYMPF